MEKNKPFDEHDGKLRMKDKAPGSVFESEGLKRIAEALRRRLNSISLGSSTSEQVALRFDLSSLSKEARAVFKTGPGADPRKAPLYTVVLVGLVTETLPQSEDALRDLGIDSTALEREWIEELDAAIKHATSSLLTAGDYRQARVLSETGNRFLYEPLYWLARNDRAEKPPKPRTVARSPAFEPDLHTGTSNRQAAPSGRIRAPLERKAQPAPTSFRTVLAVTVIAACALIGAGQYLVREEPSFQPLRGQEISTVSPYLSSALRDAGGQGSLVVGKLKADWANLSDRERYKAALGMTRSLRNEGVRRVMIYDWKQRLQVHFADGILIRPDQP